MRKYNVLITGVGGDIGQSIARILGELDFIDRIIGTDISNDNAGHFYCDWVFTIPKSNESNYFEELTRIIRENDVQFLIPTSEPELKTFGLDSKVQNISGAEVIMANANAHNIGFDKLKTIKFLEENNLPFPKTSLISKLSSVEYPAIIKDRFGSGSKQLFFCAKNENLEWYKKQHPDFIVQELIDSPDMEFTCGVFRSSIGETRSILFKRELMPGGLTGKASLFKSEIIKNLTIQVAEKLDLVGSINIQLRIRNNIPYIFEINPRFSSTVYLRHKLGFQDVYWSLLDKLKSDIPNYTEVKSAKYYRAYTEFIEFE